MLPSPAKSADLIALLLDMQGVRYEVRSAGRQLTQHVPRGTDASHRLLAKFDFPDSKFRYVASLAARSGRTRGAETSYLQPVLPGLRARELDSRRSSRPGAVSSCAVCAQEPGRVH